MTKKRVLELVRLYNEALLREKQMQEELLGIQMYGKNLDAIKERLLHHDAIIEEIEKNRMETMIPIIEEVAEFLGKKDKELGV